MVDTPTNYLAAWRKWAGLTGEQLGEKCRADKTAISRLERGRARLTHEWRERIAAALSETASVSVQAADLLRPPPAVNESLKNLSHSGTPQRNADTEEQAVNKKLLRPIVQTLVQQFGLEAVVREAASIEGEEEKGSPARPLKRREPL